MLITVTDLRNLIQQALLTKYNQDETDRITEVILFAELAEIKSHGIIRIFGGSANVMNAQPKGPPIVTEKTKVSTHIDANGHCGILVGSLATDAAIKRAKEYGVSFVGTNNAFSSSGCLSYYLEKIAKENLLAILLAASPPSTPPFGSIQPLFGTNPIAFGIPSTPEPLIFDMATSAITFGDLVRAQDLGEKIPAGVAIDKDGNPTTDPTAALDGATLSFGNSHKSAGLAMMVEVFAGIWPSAAFAGMNTAAGWGNMFIVCQPELFMNADEFKTKVQSLIEATRKAHTKDGSAVRIPGETTLRNRNKNRENGTLEIEEKLIQELKNISQK